MSRRPDPRLDRVLTVVDLALVVAIEIGDLLRGPRCPSCRERTRHLEAHTYINHQGDPA